MDTGLKRDTRGSRRALVLGAAWWLLLSAAALGVAGCQPAPRRLTSTSTPAPTPVPTARPTPVPTVGMDLAPQNPTAQSACEIERFARVAEEPGEAHQDDPGAAAATVPVSMPTPTSPPAATLAPPSPSPEIALARGPYVQSVTPHTAIVVWETDRPSQGGLVYGETAAFGSRVVSPAMGTRHAVRLMGLVPYTAYHYRVESGGAALSEGATFRTAAGPDQTEFTFAVLGDTRTQHQFHEAVAAQITAHKPDFVLHTGDLVAHGSDGGEWDAFFEIERAFLAQAPLFPALGNHEENAQEYFDLFDLPGNERWYAFDYGNARFVCLQVDGIAAFHPGSEQYAWLEETLAANTQPWLFVYFHVPPYSSVQDDLEDDVRRALTPLFATYGVDVVFNGHKHNYERNEVNGVTYVVTAGGGAPLYAMEEREPTQVVFALAHHFVRVAIHGDRLQATAISVEGEVLDEFERSAD